MEEWRNLNKFRPFSLGPQLHGASWECNWWVHRHVDSSPSQVLIISETNLSLTFKIKFLKIYFNIILPFTPKSSYESHHLWLPNQNYVRISYAPSNLYLYRIHHRKEYLGKVRIMKLLRHIHPTVTSSLLGADISLSTLFSNTLNPCSSLSIRDQYKTAGKMIIFAWFKLQKSDLRLLGRGVERRLLLGDILPAAIK